MSREEDKETVRRGVGLPEKQLGPTRLTFEHVTRTLVMSCGVRVGDQTLSKLYFRNIEQDAYVSADSLVGAALGTQSAERLSIPSWVVGFSLLFCCVIEVGTLGGRAAPARTVGLASIDLGARKSVVTLWNPGVIISELMCCVSRDELFAVVGHGVPNVSGGTRIDYFISALNWANREVRQLYPMENVYF